MNDPKHGSGWLTWRFFGWSVLFWSGLTLLQVVAPLLTGTVEFGGPGEMAASFALTVLPRAALTPPLFAIADRLSRRRARGLPYVARLAAAALIAAVAMAATVALTSLLGHHPLPLATVLLGTFLGEWMRCGAIVATAAAVMHHRIDHDQQRELLAARLAALRSQLQPHFLFNTLQAIGSTARHDANATVRMTALLGDLLRQSLRERGDGLVTLAEERDLLRPYVELQQLRFGDRLTVDLDLANDLLEAEVPDLLLQPLLENALRHGIEATPGAGRVLVRARRDGEHLVLEVHDDGAGPTDGAPDGVGLGTTRARLHGLFGDAASLTLAPAATRGTVATVRLPLRMRRGARAA